MTLSVSCTDVRVGWPGRSLIDNLRLAIAFSDVNFALPIVGRTGRGKSTLLYALAGMAAPLGGAIEWRWPSPSARPVMWGPGRDFRAAEQPRVKQFGFMLQDASMLPCFTVRENLQHTLRLRRVSDRLPGGGSRTINAIDNVLIPGEDSAAFADKYPSQLSGGQRQRMALAAAVAHDPVVLFADEPTASLDDASSLEVLSAVRRWLDIDPGSRCFVFVTHRLETLRHGVGVNRMLRLAPSSDAPGEPIEASWAETPL